MNNPRVTPPDRNPENVVAAAVGQWTKRFPAVLFVGLMMWSAPQLLLVFLNSIPGGVRIDLSKYLAMAAGQTFETVQAALQEYGLAQVFTISPFYVGASVLIALFVTPLFEGCCARLSLCGFYGKDEDTAALVSASLSSYFGFVRTNLCMMAAALIIYAVTSLPMILAAVMPVEGSAALFVLLTLVGTAALFAGTAAVLGLKLISSAVTADEGICGFRAVMRAWRLMRVRFWKNGLTIIVAGMAVNYLTVAVQSVFSASGAYIAGAVAGSLAGGVFAVFTPMCAARCYISSRNAAGEFSDPELQG